MEKNKNLEKAAASGFAAFSTAVLGHDEEKVAKNYQKAKDQSDQAVEIHEKKAKVLDELCGTITEGVKEARAKK